MRTMATSRTKIDSCIAPESSGPAVRHQVKLALEAKIFRSSPQQEYSGLFRVFIADNVVSACPACRGRKSRLPKIGAVDLLIDFLPCAVFQFEEGVVVVRAQTGEGKWDVAETAS